jgi:hypothetical protein
MSRISLMIPRRFCAQISAILIVLYCSIESDSLWANKSSIAPTIPESGVLDKRRVKIIKHFIQHSSSIQTISKDIFLIM